MDRTTKNVVVIQDAAKILNLRVFYWIINGLSLKPEDEVTLVSILHEVHTPMGYKITVDNGLNGVNQRIIEKELAKKKEEYLINEGLAHIVKHYESNKVVFKIKLFTGSSQKNVALEVAKNLKATWVILDRQMKKDEEFFLQKLSCGISILRRNNRIVRLRAPIDLPDEIQCNSHETYDESLPSIPYNDLFNIDVFPKSTLEDDEQNQIQDRPHEGKGCLDITSNINEKTCQTSSYHLSMNRTEISSNQLIDKIERDERGQDQEQMQRMSHEIVDQPNQEEEKINNFLHGEQWDLSNPTKGQMEGGMKLVVKQHDVTNAKAKPLLKRKNYSELVDPIIRNTYEEDHLRWLVQVTTQCLKSNPKERFSMNMVVSALQGIADSELCHMTDDITPVISDSRIVLDINGSQVVDQLSDFEEQVPSTLNREGITTQNISIDHMIGNTKGEIVLENSKFSACSICKSRRPNVAWTKGYSYDELQKATAGFSVENSLSESENGPTFEGLLERRIGDFGIGKVKLGPKKCSKDKCVKNFGYTAPEYLENGKLSNKTDVFSFGVILLELITGRRAMDKLPGGKSLVGWARPLLGGKKYAQLVDLKICNSYEEEKLQWLVQVTEQCLRKNPKERFTMNMVVSALQGIVESDEHCETEDSSPENSYLPHGDPSMISTQVNQKQEWIDRNQYEVERSQRLTVKTNDMAKQRNQLIQGGEDVKSGPDDEILGATAINNDIIDQINHDQQIQEKQHIKGTFHIEEMGKEVDKQQEVMPLLEQRKHLQLVDPKVNSSYDEQELVSLFHVAKNCLRKNPKERFTMKMVVSALPCVVDSNGICLKEIFPPENSNISDVTKPKDEEESLKEEDLSTVNTKETMRNHSENSEERKDNTICSKGNNETKVSQKCDSYKTCESSNETEEKESSRTKVGQKYWEGCLSYGGAREFYHQGSQDYTVCEEFFGWSSILIKPLEDLAEYHEQLLGHIADSICFPLILSIFNLEQNFPFDRDCIPKQFNSPIALRHNRALTLSRASSRILGLDFPPTPMRRPTRMNEP
ncbi:hypothetical protein VNO78_12345 [Psophocarpus tetragonolobus]|uniref:Protein kinase domain-containing protein n=1 Tax=Psophocarpus tetragonolobus TaxID=3891 RepID=A0AAN9XPC6_PSOTE